MLELDRREGLHHGELYRGVGHALEESERALIVRDRRVELTRVVESDGHAHVALRSKPELA